MGRVPHGVRPRRPRVLSAHATSSSATSATSICWSPPAARRGQASPVVPCRQTFGRFTWEPPRQDQPPNAPALLDRQEHLGDHKLQEDQQRQRLRQEAFSQTPAGEQAFLQKPAVEHLALMSDMDFSEPGADFEMPDAEFSEPSADLEGLLSYLEGLLREGRMITEVTYTVNRWTLGGVIPLHHHGLVLRIEDISYLSLDFSRRGILWDTFDDDPDFPDGTIFAKKYHVNASVGGVKAYCETTEPFSWLRNDCAHWARGFMQVMSIFEDPFEDRSAFLKPEEAGIPSRHGCRCH